MPTEVSTRTNVSHTMLNDPYFSGSSPFSAHRKTQANFVGFFVCFFQTQAAVFCVSHRGHDDDHAAHGDQRRVDAAGHQGGGPEERPGRHHRHQEVVL